MILENHVGFSTYRLGVLFPICIKMLKIVFRSEFKTLYDVFVQILLNAEKKIPVEISINPVDS